MLTQISIFSKYQCFNVCYNDADVMIPRLMLKLLLELNASLWISLSDSLVDWWHSSFLI